MTLSLRKRKLKVRVNFLNVRCFKVLPCVIPFLPRGLEPCTTGHLCRAYRKGWGGKPGPEGPMKLLTKTSQRAEPLTASMGLMVIFSKTLLDRKACFSKQ